MAGQNDNVSMCEEELMSVQRGFLPISRKEVKVIRVIQSLWNKANAGGLMERQQSSGDAFMLC